MNTKSQKEMASKILKCGTSRVKIKKEKEVEEALTRNDIRDLIQKGLIKKEQKKGTSRANAKKLLKQKSKGRRKGRGSRKGTKNARGPEKAAWMKKIRALRRVLKELHVNEQITQATYRKIYLRAKGGFFRNKKHLLYYLKEHELLKAKPKKGAKK